MRRTKEEAEQTKQAILDAAIDVFTDRGVARATLEQIARSADVTRGAVYWHFKNKIEIFDALHEKMHTPFIERIMQGLEVEHPNPVDQLQTICTNLILDLDEDAQKCKAIRLFMFKCDYSGDFEQCKARHNEKKREKLAAFEAYFARAKKQMTLPEDADPKVLALSVSCFIRGVVAEYLESPETFKIQQDVPGMMQLFFNGILTPNASSL
ncbi:TetR family transcriptional regulator [Salinimonas sp. HHU 13199]|uniref:TetR family transcriptional regulator n=1 Tax=Salinimonas profundi TaxID=2729140 RepID=A0ABR8LK03_9ALTE|nr:TetR family transcriptional regulator [Salinimonas profundi]MBD3586525.1 TetR family transcriptional regulator [Salinimonas profundi]